MAKSKKEEEEDAESIVSGGSHSTAGTRSSKRLRAQAATKPSPSNMRATPSRAAKRKRSSQAEREDEPQSKKKKKATLEVVESASEEEDEVMEEAEEEEDQKMPAVETKPANGSGHAAAAEPPVAAVAPPAAAKPPPKGIPPVEKLRIPSKHTPGKLQETRRLSTRGDAAGPAEEAPPRPLPTRRLQFGKESTAQRVATETTTTTVETTVTETNVVENGNHVAHQEQEQGTLHQRVRQSLTDGYTAGMASFHEMREQVTELVATHAPAARAAIQAEDRAEKIKALLHRVEVWVVLLLLLQLICWRPILSTTVAGANASLSLYKGLIGAGVPNVADLPLEERIALRGRIDELNILLSNLKQSKGDLTYDLEQLRLEEKELQNLLIQEQGSVKAANLDLDRIERKIGYSIGDDGLYDVHDVVAALQPLSGRLSGNVVLDLGMIDEWSLPDAVVCEKTSLANQKMEEGIMHAQRATKLSTTSVVGNKAQAEVFRQWIREYVLERVPDYQLALDHLSSLVQRAEIKGGASLQEIQSTVAFLLEVDRADQMGKMDYASVLNGASVIRTGPHATSPSLRDTLPVLNRLAEKLSLRFYGHGPEAALTPTVPASAIGQCWSLPRDMNQRVGNYGLLSVRLAKSIQPEMVVVEHPASRFSSSMLRSFRVFGYESPDASGEPLRLGSFEYTFNGARRQEFTLTNENKTSVQSITIAIDSAFSEKVGYICLYRVRILGRES